MKQGITPMNPTNWVNGDGDRYGGGEIFAMEDKLDAIRWALNWDWSKHQDMGTGKVSIVSFVDSKEGWEVDDADPLSQAGNNGAWLKKMGSIKPEQLQDTYTVDEDAVAIIQKANAQRFQ